MREYVDPSLNGCDEILNEIRNQMWLGLIVFMISLEHVHLKINSWQV
jgi:hypothetical protein